MSIERYSKFISEQMQKEIPCPDGESRKGVKCYSNSSTSVSPPKENKTSESSHTKTKTSTTTTTATLEGGVPTVINGKPVPGAENDPRVKAAREIGALMDGSLKRTEAAKVKPKPKAPETHKGSSVALSAGEKGTSNDSGTAEKPKLLNPEKKSDNDLFSTTTTLKTVDGSIGREAEKNFLSKNDVGAVKRAKDIVTPPEPKPKWGPPKNPDWNKPHGTEPGAVNNEPPEVKAAPAEEPKAAAPEPEKPSASEPKTTKRERVVSGAKERLTRSQRMSKAMHSGDLQGVVSGTYGESTEIK